MATKVKRRKTGGTLKEFLHDSTIRDVLGSGRQYVITLDHTTRLFDALNELAASNIRSAPVVLTPSIEDNDGEVYMGMIDVRDIVGAVMKETLKASPDEHESRWEKLEKIGHGLEDRKLITVLGHDVSLQFKGHKKLPLINLIKEAFVDERSHRIAVFNERGRITQVISQSDVVRFMAENEQELGDLGNKTITELGLVSRKKLPLSIVETTTAADAFQKMIEKNVSGLAVVNKSGKLVSCISESDLRGLKKGNIQLLLLTTKTFLQAEHRQDEKDHTDTISDHPISVHPDCSFRGIILRFTEERVHRIFVTDKDYKPVGVVTLSDILQVLVQHGTK